MNKGFTMIELFVVIAIIGILSSVVFLDWRHGEQLFALQSSAYKLCQDIREIQEMTMSAKICTACGNIVPPRYGLYIHGIDSSFYQLFADINNDGMLTFPDPGPDILMKRVDYEGDVYLDSIGVVGCSPTGPERGHLSFAPPDPITEIWMGVLDHPVHSPVKCSKIILNLSVGTSGEIKSVVINQSGLVYIE